MTAAGNDIALQKIEQGIYISARETGFIYETSKKEVEPDSLLPNVANSSFPWAKWGSDNNYPQRLIDAVMADPFAALLEKRRCLHWGGGLMFYNKEIDVNGNEKIKIVDDKLIPQEIKDFMFANDWPNFMQGIIADFEWWHSFCVQYITNYQGKILGVKWQRMKDVRAQRRNPETGTIDQYFLSGLWPLPQPNWFTTIPAFDRMGNASGLYRHQWLSIDKDYYPQPAWHSVTRWLYIASKIPRWILANIDNSINLKYHVKIPLEYFLKRHPIEAYKTSEERNKAIQDDEDDLYKKIDDYLAGETNVHKAFYSKVAVGEDGKPLPGWEIIPIDNKINDEAWLQAYGTAKIAMTSGVGLSPSISGEILPNGLGSGSGSDLREQFNFAMMMLGQSRQTTLEPWEMIKRRNGWPEELHLGYRDLVMQSLDQNKSGKQTQNEQSPTTQNTNTDKVQP